MRTKRILCLLSFIIPFLTVQAQWKSATLSIESSSQDIGSIQEQEGPVSHSFKIQNTGETPLIINRVNSNSRNITIDWPKEPVLPGLEDEIIVRLDPRGRSGQFNHNLTIFSNAAESGHVVTLRGNVVARPKTPADIYRRRIGDLGIANTNLSFGRMFAHQVITDTMRLYNFADQPVDIHLNNVPKHISIEAQPSTLDPEQEGVLVVTYNANQADEWGFVVNRIRLKPNDQNVQGNLLIITATIEEDFSKLSDRELEQAPAIAFNEAVKDFGELKEGVTVEHEFVFTNTGQSDLIIRRIRASCGCTTVAPSESVIKPGESSSLKASFRTQGFRGRQSKSITVITNDPSNTSTVLRLTATVEQGD